MKSELDIRSSVVIIRMDRSRGHIKQSKSGAEREVSRGLIHAWILKMLGMEKFLAEPGRKRGGKNEEQAGQWVVTNILCDTEEQGRHRERMVM